MILSISIDGMQEVLQKLHGLEQNDTKKVLKAAIYETAKEAQILLANQAFKIYQKKRSEFTEAMSIKKGTVSKPGSEIIVKSPIMQPFDYKASPSTLAAQQGRKLAAKAKVLRSGGMHALEEDGRKAFLTQFKYNTLLGKMNKTPHLAIAQRTGKEKPILRTFYSPSIPIAVGSERVMNLAEPMIRQKLARNLEKHISEVLAK